MRSRRIVVGRRRLLEFFKGLSTAWRGWDGTRRWEAAEGDMRTEATHHGRFVELLFILRRDDKPDAWQVRLPVLIAPSESLKRLASGVTALFKDEPT
jgi:Family of unknown function (DUF6228)